MLEKVYLHLFILCAILAQIIVGTLEENNDESSQLLVRQKRVIDRRPGREMPLKNGDLPYIANLKRNYYVHCVATILSQHTVITSARCVEIPDLRIYTVHSGSSYSFRGDEHHVTEIKLHGHDPSRASQFLTGVALITVNPPFVFNNFTNSIDLHAGPLLAGMQGMVAGWGYHVGTGPTESQYARRLRLISVPIMNHRECLNIYRNHFPITDEDICTYHPQKLCGNTDGGAPFIIEKQLVGIHIGPIDTSETRCPVKPDIFVLLQHLNYGAWITRNIVH